MDAATGRPPHLDRSVELDARRRGLSKADPGPNEVRIARAAQIFTAAVALWVVASTLVIVRAGYSALPFWDEWDRWQRYLLYGYSSPFFFEQHNEHRIAAPALL